MSEAVSPTPALAQLAEPADSLASIDPQTVSALIGASSDVTLVVDARGVVRDVAFGDAALAKDVYRNWLGRPWSSVVAPDSKGKIEELVRDTTLRTASRWRQVNYPTERGPDVPVRHSAIRYGEDRRLVVIGRDLRAMASIQHRLAEAQQSMEREYARIRGAEKRYRLLFQLAAEAVLIVDAKNQRIVEAIPRPPRCCAWTRKKFPVKHSTISSMQTANKRRNPSPPRFAWRRASTMSTSNLPIAERRCCSRGRSSVRRTPHSCSYC